MRRTMWVLAVAMLAAPIKAEDAVLGNLGFEKGLDGWNLRNLSGGLQHDFDAKTKREGKQSLHLSKQGGMGMDNVHCQLRGLKPSKRFRISAWMKTRGLKNAWFKCFFYDAAGKTLDLVETRLPADQDWRKFELKSKVPKGTASATVFLLVYMGGDLWIDDVSIKAAMAPAAEARKVKLDPKVRAWLRSKAVAIKTLEFDAPTADLRRLKTLLKDARIVQLGENSHGDGECFKAKARLARFLHKEMDFDVIAFESGLYECERANAMLAKGDVDGAIQASVFGIWRVREVRPLFEYLAETAKSERPLRLSGFDTRGSGQKARELVDELIGVLAKAGYALPAADAAGLRKINRLLDEHPYKPEAEDRAVAHKALASLRAALDARRDAVSGAVGERQAALLSQCLDNYARRERFEYSKNETETIGKWGSVNMRDEQMAKNFRWLADDRYRGRKIMTWAATFHQGHNLKLVEAPGVNYGETRAMGEYLHEWYGKKLFTIGFCAYQGTGGIGARRFELAPPHPDSVESLCHAFGKPFLFLPLRQKGPFDAVHFAAPMAYGRAMKGPWPKVLDALFFIDEMTHTRYR